MVGEAWITSDMGSLPGGGCLENIRARCRGAPETPDVIGPLSGGDSNAGTVH